MNKRGFTIIEMIVTVGVATLFLYGSYILLIGSISSTKIARERTTASQLATKKLEELRKTTYETVADSTETAVVLGVTYTIITTVVETTVPLPPPTSDLSKRKDIEVRVTWLSATTRTFISNTTIVPPTINVNPV